LAHSFEIYFIKAIEHFFGVYIAPSKHSRAGRILESYVENEQQTCEGKNEQTNIRRKQQRNEERTNKG